MFMNTFCFNMFKRTSYVFLILEAKFLDEYFLSIQIIQFLIFAFFSDDIFSIINTYLFDIYNFKKCTVDFILYE